MIDSIHGPFVINRHCAYQAEALIKTGRPHIQHELDAILQVIDQLPDDAIAVDAGANAGLVSVPIAHRLRARGGRVYAFEPQHTLFHALGGTVALNQLDNLHLLNMGVGGVNGTMKVPDVDYGQDADFGQVSLVDARTEGGTPTPVVTLDSLGLPRLDFLKLDVEGMEIDALRGARRLIEMHLPWCWVEYWKVGEAPIIATFAGLDYTFYRVDQLNLLCVPNPRWDPQRLSIAIEQVTIEATADDDAHHPAATAADTDAPETNWNRALDHESRCEWGHAIARWQRACSAAGSTTMRSRCNSRRATASPVRPMPGWRRSNASAIRPRSPTRRAAASSWHVRRCCCVRAGATRPPVPPSPAKTC
ncbi:FkbM family methyltransferase [Burkholderia contaminans]|uniref:FkbM family methyltransferase n=1 Tax=Burkholderia contaminans TaxID=488447 RepID=UPI0024169A06|nr:FkbM family methyltransferase [Burkholderia contaminans]WFN13787.1 FkbM family methyltransferase [Burkholderia contaminans]